MWDDLISAYIYVTVPPQNGFIPSIQGFMVQAGPDGMHTIQISGIESFTDNIPVFLEDRQTNVSQDMRENQTYTFNASTSDDPGRFILHFKPLGIPGYNYGATNIYSYYKTVYIDVPSNINGTAGIYNMLGQEILEETLTPGKINKIDVLFPSGYYVVRVVSSSNVTTQKVFVN